MDIRIVKTKRAIRAAFLELRKQQDLEKIKVVDLCALAEINKTTFYKYYEDIHDLSNQLEEEVFAAFFQEFPAFTELFTNPEEFFRGLPPAFDTQGDLIRLLYRNRYEAFMTRLEKQLEAYYLPNRPEGFSDAKIAFIISGAIYIFREMKVVQHYDMDVLVTEVAAIVRSML